MRKINHPLVGILVAWSAALAAQTVDLQLEREAIYGVEEVDLYVRVSGSGRGLGRPRLEPVSGLEIRGPASPRQRTQIVNGQFSQESVYRFLLKPTSDEPREYSIGPVTVPRGGQPELRSGTVTLKVYKRPLLGVRFQRESSSLSGATLSPFVVTYTVYYSGTRQDEVRQRDAFDLFRGFGDSSNAFGLTALDLPLLKRSEVKLFPVQVLEGREVTTLRLENDQQIHVQESTAEVDGFGYRTLVFGFQVVPLRPGPLELAPAEVGMNLVTGTRERIVRDLFQNRRVQEPVLKAFSAKSEPIRYEVQDPPSRGRPASYNGAVGKYSIEVTASPTEVDAYTPIKIEARVRCENRWRKDLKQAILENLSPPRWSREESLTRNFDVSSDEHPGTVEDGVKIFYQTVRPLGDHVKEIPPIPFPYYDPDLERYGVAYSRPVPLTVRAVNTVGGGDAIRKTGTMAQEPISSSGTAPPVSIVEQSGIAANFRTIGETRSSLDPRAEVTSVKFLCFLVGPPAAFGLALLTSRRRRDPGQVVKNRALSRASSRLTSPGTAEDASAAFQDYFRERLALSAGELTPRDLGAALSERHVPEQLQSAATRLLERLLSARFGGGDDGTAKLAGEARQILKDLDSCLR